MGSSGSRIGTPSTPVRSDRSVDVLNRSGSPASPSAASCSEEARRVKAAVLAGQQGEARDAFADLVGSHQRQAMRLALYLLRDATEADEAVQDTFVKVFTHITSYREDLPFEAWFTRYPRQHLPRPAEGEAAPGTVGDARLRTRGPDRLGG